MDSRTRIGELVARAYLFSKGTFGPGERTKGVSEHIKQELEEIAKEESPNGRAKEWVDIVILGLDGLTRSVAADLAVNGQKATSADVSLLSCDLLLQKYDKNEARDWPDWRESDQNTPINHVRGKDNGRPEG